MQQSTARTKILELLNKKGKISQHGRLIDHLLNELKLGSSNSATALANMNMIVMALQQLEEQGLVTLVKRGKNYISAERTERTRARRRDAGKPRPTGSSMIVTTPLPTNVDEMTESPVDQARTSIPAPEAPTTSKEVPTIDDLIVPKTMRELVEALSTKLAIVNNELTGAQRQLVNEEMMHGKACEALKMVTSQRDQLADELDTSDRQRNGLALALHASEAENGDLRAHLNEAAGQLASDRDLVDRIAKQLQP